MFPGQNPPKLIDPITQETKTIANFWTRSYNGEFEALFPDLTINRDVADVELGILDFTMT